MKEQEEEEASYPCQCSLALPTKGKDIVFRFIIKSIIAYKILAPR